MPSNSALTKNVDENVIKRLLDFWMSQLHIDFNEHSESYKALKVFVRKVLAIHL